MTTINFTADYSDFTTTSIIGRDESNSAKGLAKRAGLRWNGSAWCGTVEQVQSFAAALSGAIDGAESEANRQHGSTRSRRQDAAAEQAARLGRVLATVTAAMPADEQSTEEAQVAAERGINHRSAQHRRMHQANITEALGNLSPLWRMHRERGYACPDNCDLSVFLFDANDDGAAIRAALESSNYMLITETMDEGDTVQHYRFVR